MLPPSTNSTNHETQKTQQGANFSLSAQDVERLIGEATSDSRIRVLEKIAASYHEGQFDQRELAVAEQIFRLLMKDAEVRVRERLAENLKENPHIPRDIILSLTRDVREVALPILRFSEVLTDNDLLEIVRTSTDRSRHVAIAQRSSVSQPVSEALVRTHQLDVISELVKNPGASMSEQSLHEAMQEAEGQQDIIEAIANRALLPVGVTEKLISLVSGTLAEQLASKYKLSKQEIAVETEQTREQTTLNLLGSAASEQDSEKLVDQLYAYGRLSPSIILSSLCRGQLNFFAQSIARLAHIPPKNAMTLLQDRGGLGFQALYEKSGLPDSLYEGVKLMLEIVRDMRGTEVSPGTVRYANRLVEELLARSDGREIENLSYLIALIRQNVKS